MEAKALFRASVVVAILGFVILAIGLVWAIRTRLRKDVWAKYPRRLVWKSQLPLTEQWRASIAAEDLPHFVRARRGHHILLMALTIKTLFLSIAYNLQTFSLLTFVLETGRPRQ